MISTVLHWSSETLLALLLLLMLMIAAIRMVAPITFARSGDAGFVARLYAAGALLVLDAEQAGRCSGLPLERTAQL